MAAKQPKKLPGQGPAKEARYGVYAEADDAIIRSEWEGGVGAEAIISGYCNRKNGRKTRSPQVQIVGRR